MSLLAAFLTIVVKTGGNVFPQQRTFQRGVRQALGSLICLGRRCLTRIIWTNGGQDRSWSAEYFLHSRCQWEPQELFRPILKQALDYCSQRLVSVAIDDTRLRKTGRSIPQAFYQRDPLSPPFHVNLVLGLRFLQASLLVPLHRNAPVGTRALPIRFQEVSRVKRPAKRATEEMHQQYREAAKQKEPVAQLLLWRWASSCVRNWTMPEAGAKCWCWPVMAASAIALAFWPDSGTLGKVAGARPQGRAKLCYRALASEHGVPRRFYGTEKFTPEQVRQDQSREWKTTKIFYGGKRRKIRYKEVAEVCTGSGDMPNGVPFVSSSSRRLLIARAKARSCTTAIRRTC